MPLFMPATTGYSLQRNNNGIVYMSSTLPTATTGTYDFTTSSLGGVTPSAVICVTTRCTASETPSGSAGQMSIGLQWGDNPTSLDCRYNIFAQDRGDGTANWAQDYDWKLQLLRISNSATAIDGIADFDSFITNGVRVNITNAFERAQVIGFLFFCGDDFQSRHDRIQNTAFTWINNNVADVYDKFGFCYLMYETGGNSFAANGGTNGYREGLVIRNLPGSSGNHPQMGIYGIASSTSSDKIRSQPNYMYEEPDVYYDIFSQFDNVRWWINHNRDNSPPSGQGWDNEWWHYWFMGWPNTASNYARGAWSVPTSTGAYSKTDLGFTPVLVYFWTNRVESYATGTDNHRGLCWITDQGCFSGGYTGDGAAADADSFTSTSNLFQADSDGVTEFLASASLVSGGWSGTVTTAAPTARDWNYFAIGLPPFNP